MAWEWVGPVAAGAIGGVGMFFTWLTGKQARTHAGDVAEQTARAALAQAREARRAEAYVDVLTAVSRMSAGVNAITAVVPFPDVEGAQLPTIEEQTAVSAKISLYGTQAVRAQFKEWFEAMQRLMQAHIHLQLDADAMEPGWEPKVRKQREKARQDMAEAGTKLADLMNSELSAELNLGSPKDRPGLGDGT